MPASEIDKHLGARIRFARMELGFSAERLAAMIDDDLDLVKAMEAGELRVSALRLARISRNLDKPLSWFFDGLPGQEVFDDNKPKARSV